MILIKKIPDTSDLAKKTDLNAKITEIEGKIPSITGLATNSALNAISEIENKVSDHNHDKYITTPEFNTLAARAFNARFAKVDLVTKTDFDTKLKKN